nr:MAG TPA: hypothetical protein [Caudoviricetes sp.]DAX67841.1 MAG TPA: hypothetical protein [Caudoviricetes sp.]
MEMLEDIRDIIENDFGPHHPKTAKVLKFFLIPLVIAIVSILAGTVGSLIVRTFTDIGLKHMPFWIILHALITLVMYGLLHAIRAYQLYAGSGILNDPKYVVVVEKHKDWLLKVSTGKFAFTVAVDTIIVAILFLAFNFEIKVQVGSWVSAIDSKAFALAALSIYCWDAWCDMGRAIKSWVKCREHIFNRFGV